MLGGEVGLWLLGCGIQRGRIRGKRPFASRRRSLDESRWLVFLYLIWVEGVVCLYAWRELFVYGAGKREGREVALA